MKDRQCFIACHIDLVQYAETALNRALTDRAGAEYDLSVPEGIGSDHIRRVHIDMERYVVRGTSEEGGEIFGEHILACRFGTGQQKILPAEQRLGCLLPDFLSIIYITRAGAQGSFRRRMLPPEVFDPLYDMFINVFFS